MSVLSLAGGLLSARSNLYPLRHTARVKLSGFRVLKRGSCSAVRSFHDGLSWRLLEKLTFHLLIAALVVRNSYGGRPSHVEQTLLTAP